MRTSSKDTLSAKSLQQVIDDDLEQLEERREAEKKEKAQDEALSPSEVNFMPAAVETNDGETSVDSEASGDSEAAERRNPGSAQSPLSLLYGVVDLCASGCTGSAIDTVVSRIMAIDWGGWTALLLIGCLDILALFGLTVISALESPRESLKQEQDKSSTGSITSCKSEHSRSRSRSPVRSRPGSPAIATNSTPADAESPKETEATQQWKELLKDETDNVVLGLRVYTQTKDPAEIIWRLPA